MLFHRRGPPPTGVTTFTHGIIYYCARYESLPHAVATGRRTDRLSRIVVGFVIVVFFAIIYPSTSRWLSSPYSVIIVTRSKSAVTIIVVAVVVASIVAKVVAIPRVRLSETPYRRSSNRTTVEEGRWLERAHRHRALSLSLFFFIEHVARVSPVSRTSNWNSSRVHTQARYSRMARSGT